MNRRVPATGERFTVGVEEEFFLVDPDRGDLVAVNQRVVDVAGQLGGRLDLELSASQVETNTAVCHDLAQVRREVTDKVLWPPRRRWPQVRI